MVEIVVDIGIAGYRADKKGRRRCRRGRRRRLLILIRRQGRCQRRRRRRARSLQRLIRWCPRMTAEEE
jgi:hypothetical protein